MSRCSWTSIEVSSAGFRFRWRPRPTGCVQQGAARSALGSPAVPSFLRLALNRSGDRPPNRRLGESFGNAGLGAPEQGKTERVLLHREDEGHDRPAWERNPRSRTQAESFFVSGERHALAGSVPAARYETSYGRPDFRVS